MKLALRTERALLLSPETLEARHGRATHMLHRRTYKLTARRVEEVEEEEDIFVSRCNCDTSGVSHTCR